MKLLKNVDYTLFNLISTVIVGNNNQSIDVFQKFIQKNDFLKAGENINLYQIDTSNFLYDSSREYLYSLHPFNKNEYVYYGRLLSNYFRVIHVITENIHCETLILSLRNWVSLIINTAKIINKKKKKLNDLPKRICIIFAIDYDPNVDPKRLEKKGNQIHELITELSFLHKEVSFEFYPLFLQNDPKAVDNNYNFITRTIKPIVESKPVFLPLKINEKLFPIVTLPKICTREYLQNTLKELLNMDSPLELPGIISMLEDYGIILRLHGNFYVNDVRWFNEFIKTQLFNIIKRKTEENKNDTSYDNSGNNICYPNNDIDFPEEIENEKFINKKQFIEIICDFLVENLIWCEISKYSKYYFPPCIGTSLSVLNRENNHSSDNNNSIFDKYQIGKELNIEKDCFLGRRIIAPLNKIISPNMWFTFQSRIFLSLQNRSNWKILFSEDCILLNYSNSQYECRCYYRMDLMKPIDNNKEDTNKSFKNIKKPYKYFDFHVSGKDVIGCSVLLISVATLMTTIFEEYGFFEASFKFQINIIPIHFIKNWSPFKNRNKYLPLLNILHNLKNKSLCKYQDFPLRLLIPDIITMDGNHSYVEIFKDEEEKQIQFDIHFRDIFNNFHSFLFSDYLHVLLINPKTNTKYVCKKRKKYFGSILRYVFDYSSIKDDDFDINHLILFISLPNVFYPIGNTPIYLDDEKQLKLIENVNEKNNLIKICEALSIPEDYSHLEIIKVDNFVNTRDFVISKIISMNDDEIEAQKLENSKIDADDEQIEVQPARTDKLTRDDYIRICSDCVYISMFSYADEKSEFARKHFIQRKLNGHNFKYLPDIKQQMKVFYFSKNVNVNFLKYFGVNGKVCFYTFERAGDLYIAIRGTKKTVDGVADIKFNLVPYTPHGAEKIKKDGTLKTIFHNKRAEMEHIHDGFSIYADIIIDAFLLSFTELLSKDSSNRKLIICGHSLGGGLAQVISRKMLEKKNPWAGQIVVVTFGAPLIGNLTFSNWNGWTEFENLKIFNFANQKDPVVSLLRNSVVSAVSSVLNYGNGDFGYTAKYLYVFSSNTSRLETKEKEKVLEYLAEQATVNTLASAYIHKCEYYVANINKLLDDYYSGRLDFTF